MSGAVDLVVIGLGTAGRTAAELAAELGLRVVAIERDRPGGDCLWAGCVPTKALVAAGRTAHAMRTAERFGIRSHEPEVDGAAVLARIRAVQHDVFATDDDPERLRALGVDVRTGDARLVDASTVAVGGERIRTRFVLVATGSEPVLPDIPGIDGPGVWTTADLFAADDLPARVVVLGAGPAGCELAQALARLGRRVHLVEQADRLLAGVPAGLAERVRATLEAEGVDLRLGTGLRSVAQGSGGVVADVGEALATDVVLACTGRRSATGDLGLAELGVAFGRHGPVVDERCRTEVPSIYVVGDATGEIHQTHWAASAAAVAVRAMFLPGPAAVEQVVPRCTFVDPELATVGLDEATARAVHGDDVAVWELDLTANDRARAEGAAGVVVLVTGARQRLLGAQVLAPGAGEVIHELALAIRDGRRLNHLAGLLHAYPTISSAVGTLAARAVRSRSMGRLGARASRREPPLPSPG